MNTTADIEITKEEKPANIPLGVGVAVAGWIIPGFGHLLMRRWGKAVVYFVCVGALVGASLAMRGGVFGPGGEDILDRLGFFADLGAGAFYFLARTIQTAGADVSHASGDYGTRLFATAGVLNILTVLEAFEIGRGIKPVEKSEGALPQ